MLKRNLVYIYGSDRTFNDDVLEANLSKKGNHNGILSLRRRDFVASTTVFHANIDRLVARVWCCIVDWRMRVGVLVILQ